MVDVFGSSKEGQGQRGTGSLSPDTKTAKEPASSGQDEQNKRVEEKNKKVVNGVQRINSTDACIHDWVIDKEHSSNEIEAYKCSKCGAPASVRFMKAKTRVT